MLGLTERRMAAGEAALEVLDVARPASPNRSTPTNTVDLPLRRMVGRIITVPEAGPTKLNCAERNGGNSSKCWATLSRQKAAVRPP